MKIYIKPCAFKRNVSWKWWNPTMEKLAGCILDANPNNDYSDYTATTDAGHGSGGRWWWVSESYVVLDTEEKLKKAEEAVKRLK